MTILSQNVDFSRFIKGQNELKDREIERLTVIVSESIIPLPDDLLAVIIKTPDKATHTILRAHPGYPLFELRESYIASVDVMDMSICDLLDAIAAFAVEAVTEGTEIFERAHEARLRQIEQRIQKELFAATNAAMSVIDHSRRLQDAAGFAGYKGKIAECFGDDGLHDLVKALRVLLYHVQVVEAGWQTTNRFGDGRSATFTMSRPLILRILDERASMFSTGQLDRIRAYLSDKTDSVDLAKVFTAYRARSSLFNGWLKAELDNPPAALADYDRCQRERRRHGSRLNWNFVLSSWMNNNAHPHVHLHLPKYLSEAELAEVYALPINSEQQADKVLTLMDHDGIADNSFRATVRKLFARATTDGAPISL